MPPYDYDRYSRYIASSAWERKKREVRERSRGECERCGCCPHEETAHLTYDRLYDEALDDLAGLCAACHRYIDGLTDDDHAAELAVSIRPAPWATKPAEWGFSLAAEILEQKRRQPDASPAIVCAVECDAERFTVRIAPEWLPQSSAFTVLRDRIRPAWDRGKTLRRDREMWPAICADCGIDTMVPFEPRGKYARCPSCYRGEAPPVVKTAIVLPKRPSGGASAEDIARMLGSRKTVPDD